MKSKIIYPLRILLVIWIILNNSKAFSYQTESDYINKIYCLVDSVFTENLGSEEYLRVRSTIKFALTIEKDSIGNVESCIYKSISGGYDTILKEISLVIEGLNFSGYFDYDKGFAIVIYPKRFDNCYSVNGIIEDPEEGTSPTKKCLFKKGK